MPSWQSTLYHIFWTRHRGPLVLLHPSNAIEIGWEPSKDGRKRLRIDWDSKCPSGSQQEGICYLSQFSIVFHHPWVASNLLQWRSKGAARREVRDAAFKRYDTRYSARRAFSNLANSSWILVILGSFRIYFNRFLKGKPPEKPAASHSSDISCLTSQNDTNVDFSLFFLISTSDIFRMTINY